MIPPHSPSLVFESAKISFFAQRWTNQPTVTQVAGFAFAGSSPTQVASLRMSSHFTTYRDGLLCVMFGAAICVVPRVLALQNIGGDATEVRPPLRGGVSC